MKLLALLLASTLGWAQGGPPPGPPWPIGIDSGSSTDAYFIGGTPTTYTPPPNSNVTDTTARFGNFLYHIPIAAGTNGIVPYLVTLTFVEDIVQGPGQRQFQVKANDQVIYDHLDLFVSCGGFMVQCDRSFVVATNIARIDLQFVTQTRNAIVSSISILPLFSFAGTSITCTQFTLDAL